MTSTISGVFQRPAKSSCCRSELQMRDVRTLVDESIDRPYLERWAARLGVGEALQEVTS